MCVFVCLITELNICLKSLQHIFPLTYMQSLLEKYTTREHVLNIASEALDLKFVRSLYKRCVLEPVYVVLCENNFKI